MLNMANMMPPLKHMRTAFLRRESLNLWRQSC